MGMDRRKMVSGPRRKLPHNQSPRLNDRDHQRLIDLAVIVVSTVGVVGLMILLIYIWIKFMVYEIGG